LDFTKHFLDLLSPLHTASGGRQVADDSEPELLPYNEPPHDPGLLKQASRSGNLSNEDGDHAEPNSIDILDRTSPGFQRTPPSHNTHSSDSFAIPDVDSRDFLHRAPVIAHKRSRTASDEGDETSAYSSHEPLPKKVKNEG
jgi:hypothetical protein